jgi:hypothetical protein
MYRRSSGLTQAQANGEYQPVGQSLRPLRAACIGTSIYANDLRTCDAVTVDVGQSWDHTKMSRFMQGGGGRSWFTWLCLLSAGRIMQCYNGAESGSTLTQMQARFARDIIPQKPDLVFLGDATNDINTGVDDATIRGLITTMVGQAKAANIVPVIVSTIHRNDDTAKNARVRTHNEWLRRYAWANGYTFIDPFAALIDPASTTAGTLASLLQDGVLHPNVAGGKLAGQRALDSLAGLLRGNTDPSKAPFIAQHRAGPNLLVNPLFQDDVNADGKADSWGIGGAATFSLGTDSRVLGKLQTVNITGSAQTINQGISVDGSAVAVGDRLALSGLIDVTADAGSLQWNVGIYTLSQVGTWASNPIGYGGGSGGGPVGGDLPLAAFYCELTVPTGATLVRAEAKGFSGTGTFKIAQWRLINLTKLGVDSLF